MAATGTSEHIAWAEHRPLLKLATEFGVDYDDVRELASIAGCGGFASLPLEAKTRIRCASRRILQQLGASASYVLYGRIKRILGRCPASGLRGGVSAPSAPVRLFAFIKSDDPGLVPASMVVIVRICPPSTDGEVVDFRICATRADVDEYVAASLGHNRETVWARTIQ